MLPNLHKWLRKRHKRMLHKIGLLPPHKQRQQDKEREALTFPAAPTRN